MKNEIDMTHGPLLKKIVIFAVPLMFSGVLQLLFNAADIAVVGQFAGPQSIAAVGATTAVVNLLVNLFIGLSVGVNVLVANFHAAHRDDDTTDTISTAFGIGLVGSIIFGFIGVALSRRVLMMMSCPDDIIALSTVYLRIYFAGLPVIALYNIGAAVLRAIGDTKRPLYYLMAAGIVNVLLNLVFVIVLKMNVAGVALATIIAQFISCFLVIRTLQHMEGPLRLDLKKIRIHRDKAIRILKVGLPAGLQSSLFSISNILIQSSINTFGSIVVAGNSAANSLEGFNYQMMNAIYQSCVTFTSQNYGTKNESRVKKVLLECSIIVVLVGLVFGNLLFIFSHTLLKIYTKNAQAIQYGHLRMQYMCILQCLCGLMEVICGSVRGMGYSIVPMIVSVFGACVFRIIWIYTIFASYQTLESIYISYPISWALTALAHFICFLIYKKKAFAV